jgi:hypothetical protein
VWIQLHNIGSGWATFDIGYSNGKTLKTVRFRDVKAPVSGSQTTFATTFALLSVRNGVATVKYGDGSPFRLDRTRSTMVVN